MIQDVERELLVPKASPSEAEFLVPSESGYYSIFIKDTLYLPNWIQDSTDPNGLLYIGIATKSIAIRLFAQELRHKSPATFFRGLGAVLGYRPPKGSLRNKKNQRNYKFSASDTLEIVNWINECLLVSWVVERTPDKALEKALVQKHMPPMNTANNPSSLPELAALRAECRMIACA